uniref:Uncharacterized protein n=1 Tax=Pipistrellus kuhlii TaxID=59472 RepID=A0A7J7T1F8_PIPKU|nr:hypothetical protein mPipKuh1_009735 [Pipistrellus kuhlii]
MENRVLWGSLCPPFTAEHSAAPHSREESRARPAGWGGRGAGGHILTGPLGVSGYPRLRKGHRACSASRPHEWVPVPARGCVQAARVPAPTAALWTVESQRQDLAFLAPKTVPAPWPTREPAKPDSRRPVPPELRVSHSPRVPTLGYTSTRTRGIPIYLQNIKKFIIYI